MSPLSSSDLLPEIELLFAPDGEKLSEHALDAVTAHPWVDKEQRFLQVKKGILDQLPSAEQALILAPDGTELSEDMLNVVTAQPWVDKNTLMRGIRGEALWILHQAA